MAIVQQRVLGAAILLAWLGVVPAAVTSAADDAPPPEGIVCPSIEEDGMLCASDPLGLVGNCTGFVAAADRLGALYRTEIQKHPDSKGAWLSTSWWGCGPPTLYDVKRLLVRLGSPPAVAVLKTEPYRSLPEVPSSAAQPPDASQTSSVQGSWSLHAAGSHAPVNGVPAPESGDGTATVAVTPTVEIVGGGTGVGNVVVAGMGTVVCGSDGSVIVGSDGTVVGNGGSVGGSCGSVAGSCGIVAGTCGIVVGTGGTVGGNGGNVAGSCGIVAGTCGIVAGRGASVVGNPRGIGGVTVRVVLVVALASVGGGAVRSSAAPAGVAAERASSRASGARAEGIVGIQHTVAGRQIRGAIASVVQGPWMKAIATARGGTMFGR